jgi:hypothetical protein
LSLCPPEEEVVLYPRHVRRLEVGQGLLEERGLTPIVLHRLVLGLGLAVVLVLELVQVLIQDLAQVLVLFQEEGLLYDVIENGRLLKRNRLLKYHMIKGLFDQILKLINPIGLIPNLIQKQIKIQNRI